MSAHERTGWRDEDISRRHREWGYNCPAVDLDFVMAEYNYGRPVALVLLDCGYSIALMAKK